MIVAKCGEISALIVLVSQSSHAKRAAVIHNRSRQTDRSVEHCGSYFRHEIQ